VGDGPRAEVRIPGPLPAPVGRAPGIGQDQATLATDGTAYSWLTGLDHDAIGIDWWTTGSALVRITGDALPSVTTSLPPMYVVGPYVVIGQGSRKDAAGQTATTVIDTRSGAVTYLREFVAGADGGTIALRMQAGPAESVGVVRADALPPLSC
jgi:hypothetical protein